MAARRSKRLKSKEKQIAILSSMNNFGERSVKGKYRALIYTASGQSPMPLDANQQLFTGERITIAIINEILPDLITDSDHFTLSDNLDEEDNLKPTVNNIDILQIFDIQKTSRKTRMYMKKG